VRRVPTGSSRRNSLRVVFLPVCNNLPMTRLTVKHVAVAAAVVVVVASVARGLNRSHRSMAQPPNRLDHPVRSTSPKLSRSCPPQLR